MFKKNQWVLFIVEENMKKLKNNEMRSSHEIYMILNENKTIYVNGNKDYYLYKTKENVAMRKERFKNKKIAVFKLDKIVDIDELVKNEI